MDPLENVPRGETLSEIFKDSLTPPEELGPEEESVITSFSEVIADADLESRLTEHEDWVKGWIARGRPKHESSPVSFEGCNLADKDLSGCNLEKMNFKNANLQGANLKKANLRWTNLTGADFTGAEFDENSIFWGADLTAATFRKEGPS